MHKCDNCGRVHYTTADILYWSGYKTAALESDWNARKPGEPLPDTVVQIAFFDPQTGNADYVDIDITDMDSTACAIEVLVDNGSYPICIMLLAFDEEGMPTDCVEARSWSAEGNTVEEDAAMMGGVITADDEKVLMGGPE